MITQLHIKNLTLIDELDIHFNSGFSVITGETGAGKSIIVGAISLLLGNRADVRLVKSGKDKCVVEAHFDIAPYGMESFFKDNDIDYDAHDCIIRREVSATGKSRAFINDTPVTLSTLRNLGERLIDIHSQHQNLLLQQEDFQLNVVDLIAGNQQQLQDYRQTYHDMLDARHAVEERQRLLDKARENEDFLRFQFQELDNFRPKEINQEELEQESKTLSHAEEIKSALFDCDNTMSNSDNNLLGQLSHIITSLRGIADVYPAVNDLAERLDSTYIELKDIAQEVSADSERVDFDPNRLDAINEKLDTLYALEQKYHVTSPQELQQQLEAIAKQLHAIDYSDEDIKQLQDKYEQLQSLTQKKAAHLTVLRKKAAATVEKKICERLVPLGMPNVRFTVEITEKQLGPDGHDKVQFLFSANKSTPLAPVAQIASGGEIARVMLSIKALISGFNRLPTIIFDEIDTGVSGKIAEQMAQIMQDMGRHNRQVISITHLPQIAALGSTHYKVSKEETPHGTQTTMRLLSLEERVQEIAQMLSGSVITPAAVDNAKSLLGI